MKTTLPLLGAALITASAFAKDPALAAEKPVAQTAAEVARQKKLQAEEKPQVLQGKKMTYDGFLHDVAKARQKKKFFSLRQPRDPKNDLRNVVADERTGRPQGFVLFRINLP